VPVGLRLQLLTLPAAVQRQAVWHGCIAGTRDPQAPEDPEYVMAGATWCCGPAIAAGVSQAWIEQVLGQWLGCSSCPGHVVC
jgi:hypothetical protein